MDWRRPSRDRGSAARYISLAIRGALRYNFLMIKTWKNSDAKEVFEGRAPRAVPADILKRARRVLAQLNAAAQVTDMGTPPGNRLHKVEDGKWAVRVNDQYRVTFIWGAEGPEEVWLGDYH